MSQTAECKAAYAQLAEAIAAARDAQFPDQQGGLLTDFIVLTAETTFAGDEQMTTYGRLYPEGTIPWHRLLGLLEVHRQLLNEDMTKDEN